MYSLKPSGHISQYREVIADAKNAVPVHFFGDPTYSLSQFLMKENPYGGKTAMGIQSSILCLI